MDRSCPGIKPPNRIPIRGREPEQAARIELQILRAKRGSFPRPEREGLKCVLAGIKPPNIAGELLGEPDRAPAVDDRRHNAIAPTGQRPVHYYPCPRIEAS